MRLSDGSRWFCLLAIAWATSAAFALGFEATGAGLLLCMLCFAARALGRGARRRVITSLVALALPLQGIAGVSIQARGPAHFHSGAAPHSHRHVEHHHHAHGTDAVSAEQSPLFSALAVLEENRRLDAAPARIALPVLATANTAVRCESDHAVLLHSSAPGERPPRI